MKAPSAIESWSDWPSDVVAQLRAWNHASAQRLRFAYTRGYPPSSGGFVCVGCENECAPNRYGDAQLDGSFYCDDCLIALVRLDTTVGP